MSHIQYEESGELYITNIQEARTMDKSHLDRAITTCQESIEDNVSDEIAYSWYNMSDGPTNEYGGSCEYQLFEQAADELYKALSSGENVLIHCHVGQSRSVSVATAALGRLLDMSRSDALDTIHHYRPRPAYPDNLLMGHASQYINDYTEHSPPFEQYENESVK